MVFVIDLKLLLIVYRVKYYVYGVINKDLFIFVFELMCIRMCVFDNRNMEKIIVCILFNSRFLLRGLYG